jgi:hypothetical protein
LLSNIPKIIAKCYCVYMSEQSLGRPKIIIDFEYLKKLAELQCTAQEICHFFGISEDTLSRRVKEQFDMTFAEYIKKHSATFKISLRRAQLDKALSGNPTMLIWLGKQYLNQSEQGADIGGSNFLSLAYSLD